MGSSFNPERTKALQREAALRTWDDPVIRAKRIQGHKDHPQPKRPSIAKGRNKERRIAWQKLWRQTEAGKKETEQNRIRRRLKRHLWRKDRNEILFAPSSTRDTYWTKKIREQESPEDELARLIKEQEIDSKTYRIKYDLDLSEYAI